MTAEHGVNPSTIKPSRWGITAAVLGACAAGVLATAGVVAIASWVSDDSRSNLTLADIALSGAPGFDQATAPSSADCGQRLGCVEAVIGEGATIYRYESLDLARQSVIYNDADFYRSDRLVVEFAGSLTDEERFQLLQVVEGTWTGSSD